MYLYVRHTQNLKTAVYSPHTLKMDILIQEDSMYLQVWSARCPNKKSGFGCFSAILTNLDPASRVRLRSSPVG
jgi:hypothetical protein